MCTNDSERWRRNALGLWSLQLFSRKWNYFGLSLGRGWHFRIVGCEGRKSDRQETRDIVADSAPWVTKIAKPPPLPEAERYPFARLRSRIPKGQCRVLTDSA